ncbi:MAG: HipA domain-containing protein [Eubacteriales bacterium]
MDFTNCEINKFKTYGGANGSKKGICYHGEIYMLKFPQETKINKEMSYTNSTVSEYIGCKIYELLGIPVQETLLGTYTYKGKEKVVVACKDMETDGYKLKDFASVKNTIIDSIRSGYGTELSGVLETLDEQNFVSPLELKKFFWDMFIVDAFIGNFDRHNGNWGFLISEEKKDIKIAPVYDCGSCLFSEMDIELMQKVMSDKRETEHRVYVIPKSAIMINRKKITYHEFLASANNEDVITSLIDITGRIDLEEIGQMIDDTPLIDDIQKEFYKYMLRNRKELILDRAIQKIKLIK